MDVDVASPPVGSDRFRRALALLVGLAAVAGTVLGTAEMQWRKQAERAQFMASEISVDVYGRETARQIVTDAGALLAQRAHAPSVEAAQAATAGDAVAAAVAEAEGRAASRLAAIAASVGAEPDPSSGVDAATRAAIGSTQEDLDRLEARMVYQLALARRLTTRRGRAVFALSLVALAGVLAGFAAVVGNGSGGGVSVVAGWGALVLAVACGATAAFG